MLDDKSEKSESHAAKECVRNHGKLLVLSFVAFLVFALSVIYIASSPQFAIYSTTYLTVLGNTPALNLEDMIQDYADSIQMETVNLKIGSTQFNYSMTVPRNKSECDGVEMVVYSMTMNDRDSFNRRQTIREIISKTTNRSVIFRFFIGDNKKDEFMSLAAEMMKYNDIVFYDHIETYRENYVKWYTMHEYHMKYCPHVKHFVKMDDDVTADFGRVFDWLDIGFDGVTSNGSEYFLCHGMYGYYPLRNKESQWYVAESEFAEPNWPTYCYGYFIITTNDTVKLISDTMKHMNLVHMDDAFITGIVRRNTTIPLLNWPGICSEPGEINYEKCSLDGRIPTTIALHNTKHRKASKDWLETIGKINCNNTDFIQL